MEAPGQEVLAQTAVLVGEDGAVEARFTVGLPAEGRRVLGRDAVRLFLDELPALVDRTLRGRAYDLDELRRHAYTNEDAEALRGALEGLGLVAFVADGAVLPRKSGVSQEPLEGPKVVPFVSPPTLRVEVELPHAGRITGMGIPRGVTLVVGGGYHGKSTLLRALERGVYNHRPGDGREQVVADAGAVKIRAEDGRSVQGVDLSPFIRGLPGGESTRFFCTPNASGSTSQAANLVEALEAGARLLLVDEDTAATNLMIRDRRMQALVPKEYEPITPLVDRIRALYEDLGVSSVVVLGGSGDYLDVADTVIAMEAYRPRDLTVKAREVARSFPTGRWVEAAEPLRRPSPRIPLPQGPRPGEGRRRWVRVQPRGRRTLVLGDEELDLSSVEQIVSPSQARAIGQALVLVVRELLDGRTPLPVLLDRVEEAVAQGGLDVLDVVPRGDLAAFRRFELAAALNRLRSLRIRQT